jgi:arabinogalactan oligomer/maltooligosaccharide transport system permease protein
MTTTLAPAPPRSPAPPRPRGRIRAAASRNWYAWAMVTPVTVVLGVLVGYPLLRGVYLSLTDANEANVGRDIGVNHIPATYEFVGLDNYVRLLSGAEGNFYPRLLWTLAWTAACTALHYGIGLGLATLLNRPLRGRSVYRVLLILPWAVPAFVSAFAWRLLFNSQYGVFNVVLSKIGLPPVEWLNDPFMAKVSVIAVNVWLGVPFMMVALLGGLQSIPAQLYEAAEMDGATAWQRFRHITLPGLSSVSGTVILLGTIWTFNMFPIIYLLTGGGPGDATQILVTFAYERAFEGIRDYSGAATYGVLILSMLLLFASFYRRTLRAQGETA